MFKRLRRIVLLTARYVPEDNVIRVCLREADVTAWLQQTDEADSTLTIDLSNTEAHNLVKAIQPNIAYHS